MPEIIGKNPQLVGAANKAHNLLGLASICLFSIHFIASLVHQFILKDGIIRRMGKGS